MNCQYRIKNDMLHEKVQPSEDATLIKGHKSSSKPFVKLAEVSLAKRCEGYNIVQSATLCCAQARSQVRIWGGAFFRKVDFFACFLRESGLFCVFFFFEKWTFLRAFGEKVDHFACIFG